MPEPLRIGESINRTIEELKHIDVTHLDEYADGINRTIEELKRSDGGRERRLEGVSIEP